MMSLITHTERNAMCVQYLPLAERIARAFWRKYSNGRSGKRGAPAVTQRRNSMPISYDDVEAAAYGALVQGRDNWDPLLPNCGMADCVLPSDDGKFPNGKCPHGNDGYTFGAYIQIFIEGACIAVFKRSFRRAPLPYTFELLHVQAQRDPSERPDSRSAEYERMPAPDPLQDGSEFDGSPSGILWASADLNRLRALVHHSIESGKIRVNGVCIEQLREIVSGFCAGRSYAEIAADSRCALRHVQETAAALREMLVDTDYAHAADTRTMSLSELAARVTERYPHDPCKAKRMGEWLARGWVPGKQTPEGRWMISDWAAEIAMRKWGERKARKSSALCPDGDAGKDLDRDPALSDRVLSMSKPAKPARVLPVKGHTGTALPEYGGAVIGPIITIEVGQGRAQSCAVTQCGDRFYARNREAVLQRFGLEQAPDGSVRPVQAAETAAA